MRATRRVTVTVRVTTQGINSFGREDSVDETTRVWQQ